MLGVGIAFWGLGFFNTALGNFLQGVGFSPRKVRIKFNSLTSATLTTVIAITNRNQIGITVDNFTGNLRFGRNGVVLAPVQSASAFVVPAGGTTEAQFESKINLFSLGTAVQELWNSVSSGNLRKLWLDGSLKTSIVTLPVSTSIGLLQE